MAGKWATYQGCSTKRSIVLKILEESSKILRSLDQSYQMCYLWSKIRRGKTLRSLHKQCEFKRAANSARQYTLRLKGIISVKYNLLTHIKNAAYGKLACDHALRSLYLCNPSQRNKKIITPDLRLTARSRVELCKRNIEQKSQGFHSCHWIIITVAWLSPSWRSTGSPFRKTEFTKSDEKNEVNIIFIMFICKACNFL